MPGLGQELVARHFGHALVGDDDRDVRLLRMMSSALIGDEAVSDPVLVLEQILERNQDVRLVVDDQDRAMRLSSSHSASHQQSASGS